MRRKAAEDGDAGKGCWIWRTFRWRGEGGSRWDGGFAWGQIEGSRSHDFISRVSSSSSLPVWTPQPLRAASRAERSARSIIQSLAHPSTTSFLRSGLDRHQSTPNPPRSIANQYPNQCRINSGHIFSLLQTCNKMTFLLLPAALIRAFTITARDMCLFGMPWMRREGACSLAFEGSQSDLVSRSPEEEANCVRLAHFGEDAPSSCRNPKSILALQF
jgi:hypothetical protein